VPSASDLNRIQNRGQLIRAMMGSGDMPALMPPIKMADNPTPIRQYVDGGVRERAPLEIALLNGATEIYAVVLAPKQHTAQEKEFTDDFDILMRTISTFTDDVLFNDLLTVDRIARGRRYLASLRTRVAAQFGATSATLDQLFANQEAADAGL